jgi:hypothetical protein
VYHHASCDGGLPSCGVRRKLPCAHGRNDAVRDFRRHIVPCTCSHRLDFARCTHSHSEGKAPTRRRVGCEACFMALNDGRNRRLCRRCELRGREGTMGCRRRDLHNRTLSSRAVAKRALSNALHGACERQPDCRASGTVGSNARSGHSKSAEAEFIRVCATRIANIRCRTRCLRWLRRCTCFGWGRNGGGRWIRTLTCTGEEHQGSDGAVECGSPCADSHSLVVQRRDGRVNTSSWSTDRFCSESRDFFAVVRLGVLGRVAHQIRESNACCGFVSLFAIAPG